MRKKKLQRLITKATLPISQPVPLSACAGVTPFTVATKLFAVTPGNALVFIDARTGIIFENFVAFRASAAAAVEARDAFVGAGQRGAVCRCYGDK